MDPNNNSVVPMNEPRTTGAPVNRSDDHHLKLRVVGQDGPEMWYRLRMSMRMERLKKDYGDRVGVPAGLLCFLFHGSKIMDHDTPMQLQMKNFDIVKVYQDFGTLSVSTSNNGY